MNPETDQILRVLAAQCGGELAPQLPAGYPQGQAALLSLLLHFAAQEYERAAEIRVRENEDMRALFHQVAAFVDDTDLHDRLVEASGGSDPSLAISALNEANARLRRLLIALQEHVEAHDDDAGRAVAQRIWKVLIASANRRLVSLF